MCVCHIQTYIPPSGLASKLRKERRSFFSPALLHTVSPTATVTVTASKNHSLDSPSISKYFQVCPKSVPSIPYHIHPCHLLPRASSVKPPVKRKRLLREAFILFYFSVLLFSVGFVLFVLFDLDLDLIWYDICM